MPQVLPTILIGKLAFITLQNRGQPGLSRLRIVGAGALSGGTININYNLPPTSLLFYGSGGGKEPRE